MRKPPPHVAPLIRGADGAARPSLPNQDTPDAGRPWDAVFVNKFLCNCPPSGQVVRMVPEEEPKPAAETAQQPSRGPRRSRRGGRRRSRGGGGGGGGGGRGPRPPSTSAPE